MANFLKTWESLSFGKRALLVVAVLGSLAMVLMIGRIAATPSMAILYGGLDERNAGEVVNALEGMGIVVEVRGDKIYVPAAERDRARLALAREGLPNQGQAGYELLDTLSGFGTTSEMFQAAFWRAKEGELARTILATPGVRKARVHIGAGARRPFSRGSDRATASVTVRMGGAPLSEAAATSIRYLVALAVANLSPEDVAVIDAERGVILRPGADTPAIMGGQEAERRAQALRIELEELLGMRVGDGNVRVSVTVETTKQTQTISERILDPESQVPVSSETQEIADNSTGSGQAVTVASNLPDGDAAAAGEGSKSSRTETRETVAYQYSETRRDQRIEAGAVKRLGVAVLVNETAVRGEDGTITYEPRPPEELAAIEELVKSAIAYDAERGDTVKVESLRFVVDQAEGSEAEVDWAEQVLREQGATALQILALGLVALLLGLFVLRPILAQQSQDARSAEDAIAELEAAKTNALRGENAAAAAAEIESQVSKTELLDDDGKPLAIGGATADAAIAIDDAEAARAAALMAGEAYAAIDAEHLLTLSERLDTAVRTRTPEVVALLRHWLANPEADPEGRTQ